MPFSFKVRHNIIFPTGFNFSSELRKVARTIVIPLLKEGMRTNTDIEGKRFPDLEESTKKAKYKKRGHSRPLFYDNKLVNSFAYKSQGMNKVIVYIRKIRKEIAEYLQIEGVGKKKRFLFFGITEGMEKDATDVMERKLRDILNGR